MDNKSPTHILKALFSYFEKNDIVYCVVGDTEGLPNSITSDVDIIISREALALICKKITTFSKLYNIQLVQSLRHEATAFYFILCWVDANGKHRFLHPDICSDYYRHGTLFLSADDLLNSRGSALDKNGTEKGFFVPSPEMEFIYYLIKKTHKGAINQEHFSHLHDQFHQNPGLCTARLQKFWSESETRLIAKCFHENDVAGLESAIPRLKKILLQSRVPTLNDRWQEFKRKVSRILKPTGLTIALLGPDGCGKSTLNELMQQELAPAFRGVKFFHLRPYLLGNGKTSIKTNVIDPHADKPRGATASLAKLLFFLLDYTFGYWFKIRPLKVRSQLVIFDRYYHDILIDPIRYRYSAPMWIAKLVGQLLPKPDLFLVLDAPSEIIHTRKQEVPMAETERQRDTYLAFANTTKNCFLINTNQSIEEATASACRVVLDYMERRLLKRMGKA